MNTKNVPLWWWFVGALFVWCAINGKLNIHPAPFDWSLTEPFHR